MGRPVSGDACVAPLSGQGCARVVAGRDAQLGRLDPLDDHLRDSRLEADRLLRSETPDLMEAGCDLLFSLGLLYDRLRRLDEAKQVYDELLAALDRYKLDSARQRNFPFRNCLAAAAP